MKKISFFGFFMVLALVFLGIGYAAWTDAVTVTSTVDTGEMRVEFYDGEGMNYLGAWDRAHGENYGDTTGPGVLYAQSSIDPFNAKTLNSSVSNVYPGVAWLTYVDFINYGSIPAVYDYATVEFEGNANLAGILLENLEIDKVGGDGEIVEYYAYSQPTAIHNLEQIIDTALANLRLEPGEYVLMNITLALPESVTNEDDVELAHVDYSITINFRQHNVLDTNLD